MNYLKQRSNSMIKLSCISILITGTGWIVYQVRKVQKILGEPLDTAVLAAVNESTDKIHLPEYLTLPKDDLPKSRSLLTDLSNSLKFNFAKHLIDLAASENKYVRLKAVRQLARIKSLDDWHFALLCNLIDANTAVGLARIPTADPRLFMEPPLRYLRFSDDQILEAMKKLLIVLHKQSDHPCLSYFISKIFKEMHDIDHIIDHDSAHVELSEFLQKKNRTNVIPMCLESLLHHASAGNYAKDIAKFNGLPLLLEIYNRFSENLDVIAQISGIIAYISAHNDAIDELYKTGWIKILSEWTKHADIRISVPATKALANLDLDEDALYHPRLYLLHPTCRDTKQPIADIVFVHGLLGSVFFTWRQRNKQNIVVGLVGKRKVAYKKESLTPYSIPSIPKTKEIKRNVLTTDPDAQDMIPEITMEDQNDEYEVVMEDLPTNVKTQEEGPFCVPLEQFQCHCSSEQSYTNCWPRDWLPQDFDNLRVIGVNYETNLSMWAPICPTERRRSLDLRCDELIQQLKTAGLGKRPIVWITHSMGGLMVKNLLCKSFQSTDSDIRNIGLKTKGIVFYSTPHIGSSIAQLSQASTYVFWPSVEVQELRKDSEKLLEIHDKFLSIATTLDLKVVSFVETQPTTISAIKFKFVIVEPGSGNPGIGEYYEIPQDHLGICKPASRHSFLYQKVLHLISDVLEKNITS